MSSTSQVLPLTNVPTFLSPSLPFFLPSSLPSLPSLLPSPYLLPSLLASLPSSLPSLPASFPPSLPPSSLSSLLASFPPFLLPSLSPCLSPLLHFTEIEQWIYKVDGLVWQVLWRVWATKRGLSRSWVHRNLPVCIVSCGGVNKQDSTVSSLVSTVSPSAVFESLGIRSHLLYVVWVLFPAPSSFLLPITGSYLPTTLPLDPNWTMN